MKTSGLLSLVAAFGLSSCAQIATSLQQPISSDYNPLDGPNAPRYRNTNKSFQPTGPSYKPGQWVETATPNAAFFYKIPRGNASADQVLSKGSPLKVVSTDGSYLKVELEGGSVGYVPAIMVAEPSSSTDSAPFLPAPPSQPLQRSEQSAFGPSTPPSSGSSVIPPPSNLNLPSTQQGSEVVIPTTPPSSPVVELPPSSPGINSIPAPSGANKIDQSIGIE